MASTVDLKKKFPSMTPVKSPPALFRMNGCGVGLYGKTRFDPETQTYVAFWCVSLLFIPVICLRAFRVARAPRGWYFIGREPLPSLAKWWNITLLVTVLVILGARQYDQYTASPAYQARRRMSEARALVSQGHLEQAAGVYRSLALGSSDQAANASAAIKGLMDGQCLAAPLKEVAGVYADAAMIAHRRPEFSADEVADKGLKLVAARADGDPRGGVAMLEVIRPLVIDTRPIDARRVALLRKWAALEPTNLDALTPLAAALEQQGQLDEAEKILLPVRDRLGDGEASRVLGTILGRKGDYEGAYQLLWPYVQSRLDRLNGSEKAANATLTRLWDREIRGLREEKAPSSFYERYKTAAKSEQHTMVREYVNGRIRDDPEYVQSQEALERDARVVPVAMDLGIVMLQRAQAQTDTAARKSQLESTEKIFLAISGFAGEAPQYRLTLGQVDYWLGKQAEGRKLFNDYLTFKSRAVPDLIRIGQILRQLGSDAEALALAQEAFRTSTKEEDRHAAASLGALCVQDLDEQIVWLNRTDLSEPFNRALLAKANGDKALREGHDDEAVADYHKAIEAYNAMPHSSTTANETGLAYYAIFEASGDRAALSRCFDCFQEAVDLNPKDTVLLYNSGVTTLSAAILDLVSSQLDLHALRCDGNIDLLYYLYQNEAERGAWAQKFKDHPGVARALSYLEKVMVLAPKKREAYAVAYSIHRFTRNDAALASLDQRIAEADLDPSDLAAQLKKHPGGSRDAQYLAAANVSLQRNDATIDATRAKGGCTAAVALCRKVEQSLVLETYGGAADASKMVSVAEEADRAAPSAMTANVLESAHLFRAVKTLRQTNPSFHAFYAKYRRVLGAGGMLAAAAGDAAILPPSAFQDPDVQAATAIIKKQAIAFPFGLSTQEWALLCRTDPSAAAEAATNIRRSPRYAIEQSISTRLDPYNMNEALESYWLMQILNRAEDASALVRKLTAAGLAFPFQK